ncbi:MAG: hypothetical protein IPL47_10385 [Phyllobacteriaceae bacterium]|nr:hypothetical protein [Phyllobacteriaceae bacterium]
MAGNRLDVSAAILERFSFKLEQFDGRVFSTRRGEDWSAMRPSREDFDTAGAEKTAKPDWGNTLFSLANCNRFSLVFCALDGVAKR